MNTNEINTNLSKVIAELNYQISRRNQQLDDLTDIVLDQRREIERLTKALEWLADENNYDTWGELTTVRMNSQPKSGYYSSWEFAQAVLENRWTV